jgi:hypothetical protein
LIPDAPASESPGEPGADRDGSTTAPKPAASDGGAAFEPADNGTVGIPATGDRGLPGIGAYILLSVGGLVCIGMCKRRI